MPDAGSPGIAHPITLNDGTTTRTREVTAADLGPIQALHRRCSPISRALRYHAGKPQLTTAGWRVLSDPQRGTTLVTTTEQHTDRIIAMTNVMRTDEQGWANSPYWSRTRGSPKGWAPRWPHTLPRWPAGPDTTP